jgi:hypothetical protein
MTWRSGTGLGAVLLLVLSGTACEPRDTELVLPPADSAAALYAADAEAEVRGNLLQLELPMDAETLRGGGTVWAQAGPFFYLFSPPTQELFATYPDLVAIRVVTVRRPGGDEIARADLHRGTLTDVRWREALARSALAQRDGTERPGTLLALIRFGEDHTEFTYHPPYAGD